MPCEPETEKLADRTQSYKYKYYLRAGEFIEMNGLQETGMTWGKDGGQYGGSLQPSGVVSL